MKRELIVKSCTLNFNRFTKILSYMVVEIVYDMIIRQYIS